MKHVLTLALLASCAFGQQPKTFDTPEAAVQALIDATSKNDSQALAAILGSTAQGLLTSGDPQRDQAERSEFAQLANTKHSLEKSSMRASVTGPSSPANAGIPAAIPAGKYAAPDTA